MGDALDAGHIDGFCVGDPWMSLAVAAGVGAIATTKAVIWHNRPEKVLGMRADWAEQHPERVNALLRALHRASLWCEDPAHHGDLATMLADARYLDRPREVLLRGLPGRIGLGPGQTTAMTPEEGRVGVECVRTCRSRWWPAH